MRLGKTASVVFFDVGVCNFLAERTNIKPKTELFGKVFEHFIFTELTACLDYMKDRRPLRFWRSVTGAEVDFIIGDDIAIEVKSSELVSEKHLKGIKLLNEEIKFKQNIVISLDSNPRVVQGIDILPVREFLARLWDGQIL